MQTLTVRTHIGKDGVLKLETPTGLSNREVKVLLKVETVDRAGWPLHFLEKFAGSIPDFPPRAPQGEYETRDELT